jgi:hypothetical protein
MPALTAGGMVGRDWTMAKASGRSAADRASKAARMASRAGSPGRSVGAFSGGGAEGWAEGRIPPCAVCPCFLDVFGVWPAASNGFAIRPISPLWHAAEQTYDTAKVYPFPRRFPIRPARVTGTPGAAGRGPSNRGTRVGFP